MLNKAIDLWSQRSKLLTFCLFLSLFLVSIFLNTANSYAGTGINDEINFQGRLLNSQGAIVADGYYNIEFKIYENGNGQDTGDTGGSPSGTLLWTEDYLNNGDQGVQVVDGFLSVQLGSLCSFSGGECQGHDNAGVDWNSNDLWLSMNVAGTSGSCTTFSSCDPDGEMLPMDQLTSNAYSLNSGLLNGLDSSQFLQLAQGAQTDNSTASSIEVDKTNSTGDLIELQASGNDAFVVTNDGDLIFGNNANHNISVAQAGSGSGGNSLSLTAGTAGTGGSALTGGSLVLQGGAGGGTNGNGGDASIDGGQANGTGTNGTVSIGSEYASGVTIGNGSATTTLQGTLSDTGTSTFTGLITSNGGITLAANKNLTLNSGIGIVTQTYVSTATGLQSANTLNVTNSNISSTSTTVNAHNIALSGSANSYGNYNVTNGVNIANVTAQTGNTFNALNVGTGLSNILEYNNTSLINGTGILQNNAIGSTTNYSSLDYVGNLISGSIVSGFGSINDGANEIQTTGTIQGATVNGTSLLELNGASINTAGTLSNVAYLDQTQSFADANTFSYSGTALTVDDNAAINGTGTIGTLSVTNNGTVGGTLSIGTIGTTEGSLTLNSSYSSGVFILEPSTSQANTTTLTIPTDVHSTDSLCLVTLANCSGADAGSGDTSYIFNQTTQQASANIDIQSVSSAVAAKIQGASGQDILNLYGSGSSTTPVDTFDGSGDLTVDGSATFEDSTNSTTAFDIQNSSGSSVLDADTSGSVVDIDQLSSPGTITTMLAPVISSVTSHSGSGTNYTYEVTAISANGAETLASSAVSVSGNSSLNSSTNYNIISWSSVSGASLYKIYRTASSGTPGSVGLIGSTSSTSFNDTGYVAGASTPALATSGSLSTSTTYYYEVTAIDSSGGQTSPSAQVSKATSSSYNTITLSWAPVSGARSYDVYRTTTSGSYTTDSYYTVQTNNFTDTGATATGTNVVPPTTNSAYNDVLSASGNSQLTIGATTSNPASSTAQLDVAGSVSAASLGSVTDVDSGVIPIVTEGNYTYMVNDDYINGYLQIIDTSNPSDPTTISDGSLNQSGYFYYATSEAVQGNYLYVVGEYGDFAIFNISNPTSPVETAHIGTTGDSSSHPSVTVAGNYAYETNATNSTLQIINISNPYNPVELSANPSLNGHGTLTVSGNYLYIANGDMQILSLANPASPTLVSSIGSNVNWISVVGRYAYTVGSNQLQVFDISNPSDPVLVGSATTGGSSDNVVVEGSNAYVLNTSNNTLQTFNVSNPTDPISLGTATVGSGPVGLVVQGNYAYVDSSGSNTLQTYNIGGSYSQSIQAGSTETTSLQVDGNANIGDNESIQGALSVSGTTQLSSNLGVGGSALFSNQSNSSTAFQIQNSSGTNLFQVDTSGNNIYLGGNTNSTEDIGSIGTAAYTSNINIGTSTGAAQAIAIGSTNASSSLTLQAGEGITVGSILNQSLSSGSSTGTISLLGQTATNSNTTSTSTTVNAHNIALSGSANSYGNYNVTNGVNIANVTAQTGNTFNALNVGTGLSNILEYNNTSLINGTGILQNNAIGSTTNYSSLDYVGNLISGSIVSGFGSINDGANEIQTTGTIQGATVNGTSLLELNGASINTAGTLSNVAYLDQTQSFADANTFSYSGTALTVDDNAAINGTGTIGTLSVTNNGTVGGTLGVTGLTTASGGLTVAANQNLTLNSGIGIVTQTYVSTATGLQSANTLNVTNSNISSTSTTVNAHNIALSGSANSYGNYNVTNGVNIANVTAQTGNTFNALNVGTGLSNILEYNNTSLINGTGILQNNAIGSTTNYSSLDYVGNLISGSIVSGFGSINDGANEIQTTGTIQGATVNGTSLLELNGASINTAGTLSNVAYLDQTQSFADANTFSYSGTALTVDDNAAINGTGTIGTLSVTNNATVTGTLGVTSTSTFTGSIAVNGGETIAANENLVLSTGTGTYNQTYVSTATGTDNVASWTVTNSNITSTATYVNAATFNLAGYVNSSGNDNTTNAVNIAGVTAETGNTFNAINVGGGLNNILEYNNTSLINGTGILQNNAIGSTTNYSSLDYVGNLISGSIVSGFGGINDGANDIQTTGTVQGGTVSATSTIELNGVSINTAGTLSEVAYLDQNQTLTGTNTFSYSGTALTVDDNAAINGTGTIGTLSVTNNATVTGTLGVTSTSTFTGSIAVNGGETIAANENLVLSTGTGTYNQTYASTATGLQNVASWTVTNSNIGGTATTINSQNIALSGSANSYGNYNVTNGVNIANVTAQTGNTFNALNVGTGLSNILEYNNTSLINGTGILQNNAIGSTTNYSSLDYVGNLISGSIVSGFGSINDGANEIQTTGTIQGATVNGTSLLELNGASINTAGTLSNVAYLDQNQTLTGTNTFAPTTNIASVVIKQTSASSPSADIFDVQGTNGTSDFIQVTSTAANNGAVNISSFGGSNNITLQASSGTVSLGSSTLLSATGNLSIQPSSTGTLTLGSSSSANTVIVGGGSGTTTLEVGDNTTDGTLSVGTSLITGNITIGSTAQTTGTITLQSGATSELLATSGDTISTTTDSLTALQVNDANTNSVLTVDTTDDQVDLGTEDTVAGTLQFDDSSDDNSVTLAAPSTISGGSYTLNLPAANPTGGYCLQSSLANPDQLQFGSCTPASSTNISFVNEWDNNGDDLKTLAISPENVGDLIVLYGYENSRSDSIASVSGGGVSTWTKVTSGSTATGDSISATVDMWRGVVTSTGSETITTTLTGTPSANELAAVEYSSGSADTTWAVDVNGTYSNTTSSTTVDYPSLTPSNNNEIYSGFAFGDDAVSAGSTSGFTYIVTAQGHEAVAYNNNINIGTPTQPTATQSGSQRYISIAGFLVAYSGSSVILNSTATQFANIDVQGAVSTQAAGTLQAADSGTPDILDLQNSSGHNVVSVGDTGNTLIQPSTNSPAAFEVVNSNGTDTLLDANTSSDVLDIGGNVVLTEATDSIDTSGADTLDIGNANATTLNIGNTTAATDTNIQGGTGGSAITESAGGGGTILLGIGGSTGTSNTVDINNSSGAIETVNVGSTDSSSTTTIQGGTGTNAITESAGGGGTILLGIGGSTGTSNTVDINNSSGAIETVNVGSTYSTSTTTLQGGAISTSATQGVVIGNGYSGSATSLIPLTLSSSSTFTETASTCSTSLNEGAMYYNSNSSSQSIRACINGNWDDLISTSGLGIFMFGVMQDSGTNPGDVISAVTAGTSGPCKVSWASTTSVSVAPCTAYTGGRKVVVSSATTITGLNSASNWYHICFSGTNDALAKSTAGSETADMPTFSTTAPVLCLADVETGASSTISAIYDTRVYTTSEKEEVTTAADMGLGWIACPDVKQVTTCATTTAGADTIEGVIAASNGSTSTTTPNAIMVVSGPAEVKVNLTGITAGNVLYNSTTADRVTSVATTSASATYDADLGLTRSTSPATACTTTANAADCDYQGFIVLNLN